MEILGLIGCTLLALCGMPQAWLSIKEGHSQGVSSGFLAMWLSGEILTMVYIWDDWILLMNYGLNIVAILIIIYYKLKPRRAKEAICQS